MRQISAEQIDDLLEERSPGSSNVTLSPSKPKVRVMVMSAARIADLYRQVVTVAPHGADARALYLPGANVVAIPYYSRTVLGHETGPLPHRPLPEVDAAAGAGSGSRSWSRTRSPTHHVAVRKSPRPMPWPHG